MQDTTREISVQATAIHIISCLVGVAINNPETLKNIEVAIIVSNLIDLDDFHKLIWNATKRNCPKDIKKDIKLTEKFKAKHFIEQREHLRWLIRHLKDLGIQRACCYSNYKPFSMC